MVTSEQIKKELHFKDSDELGKILFEDNYLKNVRNLFCAYGMLEKFRCIGKIFSKDSCEEELTNDNEFKKMSFQWDHLIPLERILGFLKRILKMKEEPKTMYIYYVFCRHLLFGCFDDGINDKFWPPNVFPRCVSKCNDSGNHSYIFDIIKK